MDFQAWLSGSIGEVAGALNVGYAFGAGMVAAVNPCGFAMLPVYLTLYLCADRESFRNQSWGYRIGRAIGVALVVTAGFGLLFGVIGLLISAGGAFLMGVMQWLSLVIGGLLILLGIWLMMGKHLSFGIFTRIGSQIGDPRTISIKGFFMFGMAFGATSLSCTLPIFLVVVGGALASGNLLAGLMQFVWYTLGTGVILLILTVGMVFLKRGVVIRAFNRFFPFINIVSAILIILAGAYICYYWLTSGILFR